MLTAGAFEAKTHFSRYLDKVIHGQSIMITLRGEEVAMLIPAKKRSKELEHLPRTAAEAVEAIRKLRKGIKLGKNLSIKQLITEGRK